MRFQGYILKRKKQNKNKERQDDINDFVHILFTIYNQFIIWLVIAYLLKPSITLESYWHICLWLFIDTGIFPCLFRNENVNILLQLFLSKTQTPVISEQTGSTWKLHIVINMMYNSLRPTF